MTCGIVCVYVLLSLFPEEINANQGFPLRHKGSEFNGKPVEKMIDDLFCFFSF